MKLHCGVMAEDIHLSSVFGELLRREVYPEEKIILYIHSGGFVGGTAKDGAFSHNRWFSVQVSMSPASTIN
jgi:acetyl esterase/lipase